MKPQIFDPNDCLSLIKLQFREDRGCHGHSKEMTSFVIFLFSYSLLVINIILENFLQSLIILGGNLR